MRRARWLLQAQLALLILQSLRLKDAGARRAMPLPVSAPFHTPLMKPAADVMAEAFETVSWHEPSFPVVSNVDGSFAGVPRRDKGKLSQTDFLAGIVDRVHEHVEAAGL